MQLPALCCKIFAQCWLEEFAVSIVLPMELLFAISTLPWALAKWKKPEMVAALAAPVVTKPVVNLFKRAVIAFAPALRMAAPAALF